VEGLVSRRDRIRRLQERQDTRRGAILELRELRAALVVYEGDGGSGTVPLSVLHDHLEARSAHWRAQVEEDSRALVHLERET